MPNQSGKIILGLVFLLLIAGISAYFFLPVFKKQDDQELASISSVSIPQNSQESGKVSEVTKDYYSRALKISFKVPQDSQIKEEFVNISILIPKGEISVTRNGTNYENSKAYYSDLKEKNKLTPREYNEGTQSKYNYISVLDEDPKDQSRNKKSYFIYADYAVYIFSTSDEALYSVLDEIVQSFEYRP